MIFSSEEALESSWRAPMKLSGSSRKAWVAPWPSWGDPGGQLGGSWEAPGMVLGGSGMVLGGSGEVLGRPGEVLGRSGGDAGRVLGGPGRSGRSSGLLGMSWEGPRRVWEGPGSFLEPIIFKTKRGHQNGHGGGACRRQLDIWNFSKHVSKCCKMFQND